MTEVIKFTVWGTHKGFEVNPLPKLKMTGRQHWMPKAQEYVKWKGWVCAAYFDQYHPDIKIDRADFGDAHDMLSKKPIVLGKDQRARMDIKIYWASKAHGDPENIFGSIADALFDNDKNLAGSFDFEQSADKHARVEVTITI